MGQPSSWQRAWLPCPCSPALMPALSLSHHSLSCLWQLQFCLWLCRGGETPVSRAGNMDLSSPLICLGKGPWQLSGALWQLPVWVWGGSTSRKQEESMAVCSSSSAQLKPQGSCKALSVAVLGQDNYWAKSLGNLFLTQVAGASLISHNKAMSCLDQQLKRLQSHTPTGPLAAVHYLWRST